MDKETLGLTKFQSSQSEVIFLKLQLDENEKLYIVKRRKGIHYKIKACEVFSYVSWLMSRSFPLYLF